MQLFAFNLVNFTPEGYFNKQTSPEVSWQMWGMITRLFCLASLGPVNTFPSSRHCCWVGWRGRTIKEIRLRNQTWRRCCCSLYVCTIITGQQFRKHWQRFRFTSGPGDLGVASARVNCTVPEFDQTNCKGQSSNAGELIRYNKLYLISTVSTLN